MLESFQKAKEQRAAKEADVLMTKGLGLLDSKMHKQAMVQLQKAIQTSPATVKERLAHEFSHYNSRGDFESALAIGLLLLKLIPRNAKLANVLGNCARKQHNYKQANNLYRHALKVDKTFQHGFYNLAASMGKVEKYDGDVSSSLYQFKDIAEFILPDFLYNSNILTEIQAELTEYNTAQKDLGLEQFDEQIIAAESSGERVEEERLQYERTKLEEEPTEPTPQQIIERFQRIIQLSKENEMDHDEIPGNIFNLGLYAITVGMGDVALEHFNDLLKEGYKLDYLEMSIALAKSQIGKSEEAIDELIRLLGKMPYNRYLNVNLGLLYRKEGNRLLSTKYLIIAASLLEKSDGLYRLSDLIRIAEESLDQGKLKKSLKLYEIVASEVETVDPWVAMGDIHSQLEHLDEAAEKYQKALEIEPDSKLVRLKLKDIHDVYFDRAETFYRDTKYKAAAGLLDKALKVYRCTDTLRQAAAVYKLLKDVNRHDELMSQFDDLKQEERELEQEELRQDYILKGRAFLARKQFNAAIENFELAFRMKVDKDVFMFLATIYKKLNRQNEMQGLLQRWNKMVEHEERMRIYAKDKERSG